MSTSEVFVNMYLPREVVLDSWQSSNWKIRSLYCCSIIERQYMKHYTNHGFIYRNISCPGIEDVTRLGCSLCRGYWLCLYFLEESLVWQQEQISLSGAIQRQFCFQKLKLLVKQVVWAFLQAFCLLKESHPPFWTSQNQNQPSACPAVAASEGARVL